MHEYAVHVTTDTTVTDDQYSDLFDLLSMRWHGTVGETPDRCLSAQLTVPAADFGAAVTDGIRAVTDAMHIVSHRDVGIRHVEAMTDGAFKTWLYPRRADDLISVAEQADILGVSRQRVAQIAAADPTFPASIPVGRAMLRSASAIRAYADRRRTKQDVDA